MDFIQKLKESANGLHDGMGGHTDYCADLMQSAAAIIEDLFADASRYRYIRDKERLHLETCYGEAIMSTTFSSAEEFDEAVDQAMGMSNGQETSKLTVDMQKLKVLEDLPCGKQLPPEPQP